MPITDLQLQTLARDAMQRAQAGDYTGAEPLFAEVVAARPNSGQALHLLGQARLKLGRFAEAREPLERAAKFLPKEVAAQINYAGCLAVLAMLCAHLQEAPGYRRGLGSFDAWDAGDGQHLWQFRTGAGCNAAPMTWQIEGKQHVAGSPPGVTR